ncbi:MAG: proline dehydrogenase family protein, partial [Thaumarchaeota archaeon]|nr:proline dehydrogenase family protein [Nitrososphaerota archaeon]
MGIKQDLVYKIAKRWISGREMSEALETAKGVNKKGIGVILNYLGEDVTETPVAERHAEEYLRLQRAIADNKMDGCVSAKLTQFGLSVDEKLAIEKTELLARQAKSLNQMLWLDMEGSKFTDKTLEIYEDMFSRHDNLGVALQAYMKRSESDLMKLIAKGGKIRLVKGAYREPSDLVYRTRKEVRGNFTKLMKILFERGNNFAVATHDSVLIDGARELAKSHRPTFEFEMLKG